MSIRRCVGAVTGMAALAGGLAVGVTAALPTVANATTCSGGTTVPGTGITSCTSTGTVGLLSGGLTINGPAAESWSTTLNGQTQLLFDTTPADEGLVASDLRGLLSTGTGSGWDITASGTEPEQHIEAVAAAFELDKPYLVSRWRWPDRFNP